MKEQITLIRINESIVYCHLYKTSKLYVVFMVENFQLPEKYTNKGRNVLYTLNSTREDPDYDKVVLVCI